MLGKIEHRRRRGHQRIKWLDDITSEMGMNLGKLWEMVRDRDPGVQQSMGAQRIRQDWATEQQFHHQGIEARNGYACELLEGSCVCP